MHATLRTPLLVLGVIALASTTACGGGASGLSADEFAAEMNDICEQVQDDFADIAAPTDLDSMTEAVNEMIDISTSGVDDVAALDVSGDLADTRDDLADALDEANGSLDDALAAAEDGDQDGVLAALDDFQTSLEDFRDLADDADLETCATDNAPAPDDTTAPDTTAPETTAPTTTEPVTTAPDITSAPVDTAAPSNISYIDVSTLMAPWVGSQIEAITEADAAGLVASLSSDPAQSSMISAVGAANAIDDATGATSTLIFIEFNRELSADEAQQFLDGAAADATDSTEVDANGLPGYLFQDADGTYGFVSVRGTTAVIVASPDLTAITTAVDGLFTANPGL